MAGRQHQVGRGEGDAMNKKNGARLARRGRGEAESSHEGGGDGGTGISAWSVDAGLPVSHYMKTDVAYLRDNMWVDAAVTFLESRGLHDAPVLDSEG